MYDLVYILFFLIYTMNCISKYAETNYQAKLDPHPEDSGGRMI